MSAIAVLSAVVERSRSDPGRPAVKDTERELTYAELCDEAAAVAAGLVARSVGQGDRVTIHLPNSVDFVVAALASLWAGAIFVPLAVTDPTARKEGILDDCSPTLTVVGEPDPDQAEAGPGFPVSAPSATLAELGVETGVDLAPVAAPLAYAIYTSGTTGAPKGVLIPQSAFAAAVTATVEALGLDVDTRTLCVSPFHFDGSFGTLFPTLYCGGAVVIRPREALLFPRTFFNAVTREAITYTGFSPSYLRLLLASPQMDRLADSTVIVALGGEACAAADVRSLWAVAPNVQVFNRYGPTETTIAVTHQRLTPELVAEGTIPIGRPHAHVSFHLVDEVGQLIDGPDRTGELYIGGAQLMAGYWGAPELTADVLRSDVVTGETVYRTGDLVYRTPAGDYVYVDRADRVIKRLGIRISLVELSEALASLPGVSAGACTTYDDEGQLGIVAFVVTDHPVAPLELRRAAAERLPESMLPNRFEVVEALPLTASSKLDERRLLAEAGLPAFGVSVPA